MIYEAAFEYPLSIEEKDAFVRGYGHCGQGSAIGYGCTITVEVRGIYSKG